MIKLKKCILYPVRWVWLLTGMIFSCALFAQDSMSLKELLQRMQPHQALRIRYYETRYSKFFTEPWKGTGFLYTLAPEILLKEQTLPERELMGVEGKYLYYLQPKTGLRLQSGFHDDDPVSLHVLAIQALVFGDEALLKSVYEPELLSNDKVWKLVLTPARPEALAVLNKIEMNGLLNQPIDEIVVFQSDGDRIVYALEKPIYKPGLAEQIHSLAHELKN